MFHTGSMELPYFFYSVHLFINPRTPYTSITTRSKMPYLNPRSCAEMYPGVPSVSWLFRMKPFDLIPALSVLFHISSVRCCFHSFIHSVLQPKCINSRFLICEFCLPVVFPFNQPVHVCLQAVTARTVYRASKLCIVVTFGKVIL